MRLKQIKLSGFKSFCDSTELTFPEAGISMVVGPNGCGKSNVVDAIRWALGEQSPKHMRSASMSDVIFAGSTSRKPVGRAEVTLIFDNSDRTALEKYNEYTEIAVTRRLYRSGDSDYMINKLPCRLLDVRELIMDTGAGGRSYSIVEQGRVDEFVTASPQDRRAFMEEAAGIVRYKARRGQAEKKLEQTRQNLLRVEDVLRELDRQEGALREQMQTAREFRELQGEQGRLEAGLARLRHDRSKAACAELEETLTGLSQAAGQAESSLAQIEARVQQQALELARRETALRESRRNLNAMEREIQADDTALQLKRQERDHAQGWSERLGRQLTDLERNKQEQAGADAGQRDELAALEARGEGMRADMERREDGHTRAQEEARVHGGRLEGVQEQLLECHTQLSGIENQQAFLAERLDEDSRRRAGMAARLNGLETELVQVDAGLQGRSTRMEDLRASLQSGSARLEELGQALQGELEAQRACQHGETRLEGELVACRSRLSALQDIDSDHQGFGDAVRAFLAWLDANPQQREALGVMGPLADLLDVPAEMVDWAGDFLAPHLETIVVRREAALPALAEALAAQELGGLRFLALDSMNGSSNGNGNGNGGGHGNGRPALGEEAPLAALLGVPSEAPGLGQHLFGGTHLLPAGQAVYPLPTGGTAAGGAGGATAGQALDWLCRDGSYAVDHKARVTLGRGAAPAAGVLRRRAEIARLDEALLALTTQREAARQSSAQVAERSAELQRLRDAQQEQSAELTLSLRELEQAVANEQRERERLKQLSQAAREEAAQADKELQGYRARKDELDEEVKRWGASKLRLEAELEDIRQVDQEARETLVAEAAALTEVRVALEGLESRRQALAARLTEREQEAVGIEARLMETRNSLGEEDGKAQAAVEAIAALEERQRFRHRALEDLRREERKEREAHEGIEAEGRKAGEGVSGERKRLEQARTQRHEVELALATERMRLQQLAELLAELPAAELLTAGVATAGLATGAVDEKTLNNRLIATKARLARMEGVNLGAPEEYEALEERLTFLRSESADLERAIADLESSIRSMNMESRKRFRETFDSVNEKFEALFPQVFGGGEARLVMTDSDDPLEAGVDIVAQPPGKKLQSLNLLSGGEKALTAISLIFSFFLYKPSPFCVLDEVDAPLDDVNVTRFNRLIESMTEHAQFIIITHNKRTMEVADLLYGVTMEEAGVSKVVSVHLAAHG